MRWLGYVLYRLAKPEIRRRLNGSARVRVLLIAGDEILLVKGWISRQRWMLPGGGLEAGESAVAAAQRELAEELGLDLAPSDFTALIDKDYADDGQISWHAHLLSVNFQHKPKLKRRRLEISDANWVRFDHLPAKRSPLVDEAIDVRRKAGYT